MTKQYKKELVEVSLPLLAINRGCEEDKNLKTGQWLRLKEIGPSDNVKSAS